MSGKVHSEHIVVTKVLMPMGVGWVGGWVSRKVHSEHIVATKVLMPVGGGGIRESVLLAHCCYISAIADGGLGWVSRKVHSEHIVATKVLLLMGGWVGCPGKCTLSTLLLQKCSCPCVCVGGVSRKVHSEHIVATKVLMPMCVCVGGCLGKCILSTFRLPARGMQSIFELPSCVDKYFVVLVISKNLL